MNKLSVWIVELRLRTLLLSFSLIIMGSAIAYSDGVFSWGIFALAISTTLFLQVLSNISNDYGDAVSGVDFGGRVGPARGIQNGQISLGQMRVAMQVLVLLSLVSGVALLWVAYPRLEFAGFVIMLSVGILAIAAAIFYTVGKHPYGYMGLGDLSTFIFFGLVGVVGSHLLYAGSPSWPVLLPASSVGLLSVGVLNMNNMRDYEPDRRSGKNTLIVRMGLRFGRAYQFAVILLAAALMVVYLCLWCRPWQFLSLLAFVRLIPHLAFVGNPANQSRLDTQLKVVSSSALLLSVLFALGSVVSQCAS